MTDEQVETTEQCGKPSNFISSFKSLYTLSAGYEVKANRYKDSILSAWPETAFFFSFFLFSWTPYSCQKEECFGESPHLNIVECSLIYDKCQTTSKSFHILLEVRKVLSPPLQRQSSMEPAHHRLMYSTGIGIYFFVSGLLSHQFQLDS